MNKKEIYQVKEVFTPSTPAKITFVERESLYSKLIPSLDTPGKQLIIYGHSGSGKTTLLVNKLRQRGQEFVTTRCMSDMSFDSLILNAFDQLGAYYESETTRTKNSKITSSLRADYAIIKAKVGSEISDSHQIKSERFLPPQLTAQTLARLLLTVNSWWILEDFHKINSVEKTKLTQMMKIFMDMSGQDNDLKIIAIGAVDSAREIIQFNPDMKNRVSEIRVPLMTQAELKEIILKGEEALNFHIPTRIRTGIIDYSNGLAAVCHQLCLNICVSANIKETNKEKILITNDQLSNAIDMYLTNTSDTLKYIFDKAFKQKKRKYNNGALILDSLSKLTHDGVTYSEILAEIHKISPQYPPSNLTFYLKELQKESRGAVIRYDTASGKFSFSDPIYYAYAKLLFKSQRNMDTSKVENIKNDIDFDFTTGRIEIIDFNIEFSKEFSKELSETIMQILVK